MSSFLHSFSFLYYKVNLWGGLILKAQNTLLAARKMKSFRRMYLLCGKKDRVFHLLQLFSWLLFAFN